MTDSIHYRYLLTNTDACTGYFSCEPPEGYSVAEGILWLSAHPLDNFMHQWLLRRLTNFEQKKLRSMLTKEAPSNSVLELLFTELACLQPRFENLLERYAATRPEKTLAALIQKHATASGLPYLRWSLQEDALLQRRWVNFFQKNIQEHRTLEAPTENTLPPLYSAEILTQSAPHAASLQDIYADFCRSDRALRPNGTPRPPAQETAAAALQKLEDAALFGGIEMRHVSSLSPIALLRAWRMETALHSQYFSYTLTGNATTYGRGLSLGQARASYAMEMVERASSYATLMEIVAPNSTPLSAPNFAVTKRQTPAELIHARRSDLTAQGKTALNPNHFPIEAPYNDEPLYWIAGQSAPQAGSVAGETIYVPTQMVFLFCNLPEIALSTSHGSTGLASGNTLSEAKLSALTEILERDAEACTLYDKERCFTLTSADERISMLLQDYAARGINVQFQDISTSFGMPAYQCFVMTERGEVVRGMGAGLNAQRAILSALTETPFPYPQGPASGPMVRNLPQKALEELPNYSLGDTEKDLALLEALFAANGRTPVYVDVTREDLAFPVVRALVPNMELSADFSAFSRVSPRLYEGYLQRDV